MYYTGIWTLGVEAGSPEMQCGSPQERSLWPELRNYEDD